MAETVDADLHQRAAELLAPGDIELHGAVLHTDLDSDRESEMHQLTLDADEVIADFAEKGDTYIYSGNDDERFGVNQHQGLTLDGDEFVWECQQLLREGTYDVVIYWEATDDHAAVVDALDDELDATVVGVTEDGPLSRD
ncbi:DUF5778 family protein [Halospeciosus flavus]|uniref:DUF5778 family protein n=1 Tax=Halospeciosus flavus TaxID=3032283 RepID=A0ABD5Z8N9_9EURY|nr:DUF5778 family protein [Halospeciosus flavus]